MIKTVMIMRFIKYSILFLLACFTFVHLGAQDVAGDANELIVTGTVFEASSKMPLAFAEVTCGNYASTFADDEGVFEIQVRSLNDRVIIEAPGYHPEEVVLAGRSEVKVYLKEIIRASFQQDINLGFYNKKRAYVTNSVSSAVAPLVSEEVGLDSPENAFATQMSGVQVINRSGIPGVGSDIFVRGLSSLNATNQPLVIVDGMIYDISAHGNSMISGYTINPLGGIEVEDIESVTVLKDAAAIYGAKAANGVVLITTKRARKQATTIDLKVSGGMNLTPKTFPMLDGNDYKSYLLDVMGQEGGLYAEQIDILQQSSQMGNEDYYRYNNNTDWLKEVFRSSFTSNYRLNIAGGDDVALYSLTAGFAQNEGNVKESEYTKFHLRFNSDINVSKYFQLNSNISFVYTEKDLGGTGYNNLDDIVNVSRLKAPFLYPNIRNQAGDISFVLEDYDFLGMSNPVAILDNHTLRDVNYRFFGSFDFNVIFNKYLTASNLIGISFDKDRESIFLPSYGIKPTETPQGIITNQMKARVARHLAINNDLRVKYNRLFSYNHDLNAIAGLRVNLNDIEEDWGEDYSSANDMIRTLGNGLGVLRQKGGYLGEWNSVTMYLSADYDYQKKYFLNLAMSLDGSSRFGKDAGGIEMFNSPFGFFPSISGAWLLSSESFMNDIEIVDLLKIRAGYGITGNDDIGNYSSSRYYVSKNLWSYQGVLQGNLYNPKLKWETNSKTNVGLDIAILNERVGLSVDLYQNVTDDMIDYVPVSIYSGFESLINSGKATTKGADFTINTKVLNKPLKWDIGATLSMYKTKVDEVYGGSKITELYGANILTEVGQPLGLFYGYKTDGIFSTQADADNADLYTRLENTQLSKFNAGDVRFVNTNPEIDNVIDENDMVVIGDPNPDFYGNIFSQVSWKNFKLDVILSYSYGRDVYNYQRKSLESMSTLNNQTKAVINRWMFDGQETTMPRAAIGDPMNNNRFSDRWIEDGSYIKLKNITLSYKLPYNPLGIQGIELFGAANNILTLSGYKGLDPEFSAGGYSLVQGIDLGLIPLMRTVMFGVKIGL